MITAIVASAVACVAIAGDSLSFEYTYPSYAQLQYESVHVANFGEPGTTAEHWVDRVITKPVTCEPSKLHVWLGVNDAIAGVSASMYHEHLDAITDQALSRWPGIEVLVSAPPVGVEHAVCGASCASLLAEYVDGYEWTGLPAIVQELWPGGTRDGIHPDAAAHLAIGDEFEAIIVPEPGWIIGAAIGAVGVWLLSLLREVVKR